MNRASATIRLTIGLVSLTTMVVLAAITLGFVPDRQGAEINGRVQLCETIAINCSLFASRGDTARMEASLRAIVERNVQVLSAGLRRDDGHLLVEVGDHASQWPVLKDGRCTDSAIVVPITANSRPWGNVEVRFHPLIDSGLKGALRHPLAQLSGFVMLACLPLYLLYLRKMLQHLDPSQVIPDRVRAALDTLTNGLLVLDRSERIVMANRAFAQTIGRPAHELQGLRASHLPWTTGQQATGRDKQPYPWWKALHERAAQTGIMLGMHASDTESKTFMVNSTPILTDDGVCRGVLTSFDDVTQLENSRAELARMLDLLKASREEVHRQNEELKILATKDPLTSCLNRRSFLGQFETQWNAARRYGVPVSCIMVDVDHFKAINDNYGHAMGDQVLQQVAGILNKAVRDGDLVCRYGGEEFTILLPHLDIAEARRAAERFRSAIESSKIHGLSLTASFGVSAMSLGAKDPHELLNQADKCLYVAKRNGRNRVVAWDEVPKDADISESKISRAHVAVEPDIEVAIPFHAVTALISALSYRDQSTAEHSRRVADLCVATANGLMSVTDSYVLEIAALLHDIGKIGVPDSILLKPGPLTPDEWRVMQVHDRIGVEIIRSTFASKELAEIVLTHHSWYGGNPRETALPTGEQIPLAARILTIADAYDAMVSDRVYRKGRDQAQAFEELRRFAGKQFDGELVERFIDTVQARDTNRSRETTTVSKQTALKIGLEIERLARTLDNHDILGLAALAGRLKATAAQSGINEIADIAAQLEASAARDPDLAQLIELTQQLMALCRSTQSAYLQNREDWSDDEPDSIAEAPVDETGMVTAAV
jgi:diguanylate cyclase (GGDEF)-like protein/putative nucleotidyltransferase with HDIG domain